MVTCWESQPPVEQVCLAKTLTLAMNSPSMRKLARVRQERCFYVIHLFPMTTFPTLPTFLIELQNGNCALELLLFLMTIFSELPAFVTESPNGNYSLPYPKFPLLCLTTFLSFCQSYDIFYFLLGKLACPSGPRVNGNLFSI